MNLRQLKRRRSNLKKKKKSETPLTYPRTQKRSHFEVCILVLANHFRDFKEPHNLDADHFFSNMQPEKSVFYYSATHVVGCFTAKQTK